MGRVYTWSARPTAFNNSWPRKQTTRNTNDLAHNDPLFFFRNKSGNEGRQQPTRKGGRKWCRSKKNQESKKSGTAGSTSIEEKMTTQTVVNISSFELSSAHLHLLSKGLTFCPNIKPDWFQLELDLFQFFRKIKLRVWFDTKEPATNPNQETNIVKNPMLCLKDFDLNIPSNFVPNLNVHPVETFIGLVRNDISMLQTHESAQSSHPNMTNDITALQELSNNHGLTIKPADKGGAVVVMNTSDYLTEARNQLSDNNVYRLLAGDPKWDFAEKNTTVG